jgi:hypothetical protein
MGTAQLFQRLADLPRHFRPPSGHSCYLWRTSGLLAAPTCAPPRMRLQATHAHIGVMRAWSMSALNSYYREPVVAFLNTGHSESGGAAVAISGYYITPHCDPGCCQAFGGVSKVDLGPFRTADKAREWSRKNLVKSG